MAYVSPVLLFKRILDFKLATLGKLRNKRQAPRYSVGPGFPLKGTINLCGLDSPAKVAAAAPGSGYDWAGSLANLSSCGVSLLLPPAAISVRGERSLLRLTIGQYSLQFACVVTYFRVLSSHAVCGLTLEFADFPAQKAFMQLHEAVRIGAAFAQIKPSALPRPLPGLSLEQFQADSQARLTVWRTISDRQIESFELVIGDHCLRGEARGPTLEVYARQRTRDTGKAARSAPAYNLSAGITAEVRQLFRWVVPNLTKEVPADLRAFMQQLINDTQTSAERKLARPPPLNFAKPGPTARDHAGAPVRISIKPRNEIPGN